MRVFEETPPTDLVDSVETRQQSHSILEELKHSDPHTRSIREDYDRGGGGETDARVVWRRGTENESFSRANTSSSSIGSGHGGSGGGSGRGGPSTPGTGRKVVVYRSKDESTTEVRLPASVMIKKDGDLMPRDLRPAQRGEQLDLPPPIAGAANTTPDTMLPLRQDELEESLR